MGLALVKVYAPPVRRPAIGALAHEHEPCTSQKSVLPPSENKLYTQASCVCERQSNKSSTHHPSQERLTAPRLDHPLHQRWRPWSYILITGTSLSLSEYSRPQWAMTSSASRLPAWEASSVESSSTTPAPAHARL